MTRWLYPKWYQDKVAKYRRGEIDWDGNPIYTEAQHSTIKMEEALGKAQTRRIVVHLRLDALSGLFNLVSLLGEARKEIAASVPPTDDGEAPIPEDGASKPMAPTRQSPPLEVHGLRLVELTERTSSVMQSAELDEFANNDVVFSAFQTFSRLAGVGVAGHVSVIPTAAYAETLVNRASEARADFVIVPWSNHGTLSDENSIALPSEINSGFDRFFSKSYIDYVQGTVQRATCITGIFISRGPEDVGDSKRPAPLTRHLTGVSAHSAYDTQVLRPIDQGQRIFVPYIGGKDDQAALLFVLQLAHNPHVSITVAYISFSDDAHDGDHHDIVDHGPSGSGAKEVIAEPSASDLELLSNSRKTAATTLGGRVKFIDIVVGSVRGLPDQALALAHDVVGKSKSNVGDLVVVGRRHVCLEGLVAKDASLLEKDFQRTVGVIGDRFARSGINAGLLVINNGQ